MLPKTIPEFENLFVEYFESPKVILFLSEISETSKKFENALKEIAEDLDEAEVCLIKVKKENKDLLPIFEQYNIEKVPTVLMINYNLSVYKTLTDISPGDILLEMADFEEIYEKDINKENLKYKSYFERYLKNNKLCLFSLNGKKNENHEKLRNFFLEMNFSFKELKNKDFRENNSFTILAHLGMFFKKESAQDLENPPLAYFNKNLIYSFEKGKNLLEIHQDLFDHLNKNENDQFEIFLKENKIAILVNSKTENWEVQNNVLKELEKNNVIFTYIDLCEKQNLFKFIREKLGKIDKLEFPILKNSKDEFFNLNKVNFMEKINKENIVNTIDEKIKYLIASKKVFIFMKGSKQHPFCKFSRKMVNYLNKKKIDFGFFNIFTNQELRERLKVYSNWKTYPQLYINQKLIGGNDVVDQLEEIGEMDKLFNE